MEIVKDKNQRAGLIGTLLVHGLLFLFFILFGLTYPDPLPQQSIQINFGTSNDGSGEIQPDESPTENNATETVEEVNPSPNNPTNSTAKTATQDNTETISQPKEEENPKKTEPEKPAEPEVNKKALFQGKKDNPNKNNKGEGETGKPGDQGDPNGDKNAKSHTGGSGDGNSGNGPGGNGDSYKLGYRKALEKPRPIYDCQEEGKVVVKIYVDKLGNVKKVDAGIKGTTNPASCLLSKAKEAAMKTKWSAEPDAPELQIGEITYTFKLN